MRRPLGIPLLVILLALAGVLIFAGANAHMFYVALTSQPDCVAHLKDPGSRPGEFRAAKSAC